MSIHRSYFSTCHCPYLSNKNIEYIYETGQFEIIAVAVVDFVVANIFVAVVNIVKSERRKKQIALCCTELYGRGGRALAHAHRSNDGKKIVIIKLASDKLNIGNCTQAFYELEITKATIMCAFGLPILHFAFVTKRIICHHLCLALPLASFTAAATIFCKP